MSTFNMRRIAGVELKMLPRTCGRLDAWRTRDDIKHITKATECRGTKPAEADERAFTHGDEAPAHLPAETRILERVGVLV